MYLVIRSSVLLCLVSKIGFDTDEDEPCESLDCKGDRAGRKKKKRRKKKEREEGEKEKRLMASVELTVPAVRF